MLKPIFEILVFGSLLLLSFLMIANPLKANRKANAWLGVFLFLWALFWVEEVLYIVSQEGIHQNYRIALSFVRFLTPIPFYISINYFTTPNYRLDRALLWVAVLPLVYLPFQFIRNDGSEVLHSVSIGLLLVFRMPPTSHKLIIRCTSESFTKS